MIRHNIPGYQGRPFTPQYTVIHHTAGTNSLHICKYGRPGIPGPLCQYLIAKDGTVHHITDGYANHVGEAKPGFSNYNCIGIELENRGDGRDPYPEAQLTAARDLCRKLGLPVYGHKEICSPPGRKIDPSFDMDAFRASLTEDDMTPDDIKHGKLTDGSTINDRLLWTNAQVDAIRRELADLRAGRGTVDVNALAKAVADELHRRMAQ